MCIRDRQHRYAACQMFDQFDHASVSYTHLDVYKRQIKKMLTLLGAREDQVESVSLGEEKPKNEGQNEAAWAENRRGDMLYNGEF